MRILHVAAEMAPYAKSGGLADVIGGLAGYQHRAGHDVRVLLPDYRQVRPPHLALVPAGDAHHAPSSRGKVGYACRLLADGGEGPGTYFLDCREFFGQGPIYGSGPGEAERFLLLCRAAMQLCRDVDWWPDIFHCHDWHAALLPCLVRAERRTDGNFAHSRSLLTIHNIGYQGIFPVEVLDAGGMRALRKELIDEADATSVNFLRAGILAADALSTVSPTHATEIQSPAYGMGLEAVLGARQEVLTGILNGADYQSWNPARDPALPAAYSAAAPDGKSRCKQALIDARNMDLEPTAPLAGMVSRLVDQKGIDLVLAALPAILSRESLGLVVLGDGEKRYTEALGSLTSQYPGRVSFVQGYDDVLARRIIAGSDLFLVPSRYEPCGLTQIYAMRYGTVPVVRQTGGLADTVSHFDPAAGTGTGSVFRDADPGGLGWALETALGWYANDASWRRLRENGFAADFSWQRQGPRYDALYRRTLATD